MDPPRPEPPCTLPQMADWIPAPVWLSGPDLGRTYFNRSWLEFTGRSLQQETGDGWQQGVHPEDLPACREQARLAAAQRAPYTLEYRLWHSSGTYRWVLDRATPRIGEDGAFLGYIGLGTDITDLKLAQEALTASEEEFRSLVTNIPGVVYRCALDRAWSVDFVSPLIETLSGYPPEAFTQGKRGLMSLIHPEERDRVHGEIRQQLRERGSFVAEYRILDKSGAVHWVLASGRAHGGAGGRRPDHLSGVLFDVTPIKAAEERLRQTAIVFDNTTEGILITDANGKIVAVNRAFSAITGYASEEVLGKNPRMLASGRHDESFYKAMWQALGENDHWRGEIWNRHKGGEIIPLLETISAVRDESGRVTGYVAMFSDISHIKQTEARLVKLAYHDALTGLPNRLLFDERLTHAIEQAARHGERLAVLYLDLDHFKQLNDNLGHQVGDALLEAIAARLKARLRKSDTLSRRGGDEFTLLLENLRRPEQAANVARDILRQLAKPFHLPSGETVQTGTSIGISLYPDDGRAAHELIERADAAMYEAKSAGGGQYRFYTPAITQASRERAELEARLREAVQAGRLQLVYQPLYDLAHGQLVGTEALLRWSEPDLGEIPAERFIPMVEELGLIAELGDWALRQACAQAVSWDRAGVPPLRMAVNISLRQLLSPGFASRVQTILADTMLPPARLDLELSESTLLALKEPALADLRALRGLGVCVTVEDFGMGLSALARLQSLPVDRLKIDRSFVHALPHDNDGMRLIHLIVTLARVLRLQVVAEGVETEAQMQLLRDEQCDLAQGFLLSKPVPPERIPELSLQAGRLSSHAI
ncbi:MAG: EAL domain-containing protein [Thiobacillaceae bacterium]